MRKFTNMLLLSVFAICPASVSVSAADGDPVIFHISDAFRDTESVLAVGQGFDTENLQVRGVQLPTAKDAVRRAAKRLPQIAHPPAAPPEGAKDYRVLYSTDRIVWFAVPGPEPVRRHTHLIWIGHGEAWTAPHVLNHV